MDIATDPQFDGEHIDERGIIPGPIMPHQLMMDIMAQQATSTNLVLKNGPVKKIFVDGGFSNNSLYMRLLAEGFPGKEIFAANTTQASALGAAMVIHEHWNPRPLPTGVIELREYSQQRPVG